MVRLTASFAAVCTALNIGLITGVFMMSPARTLENSSQLLSGGGQVAENGLVFTAPGLSDQFGINDPSAGKGEQAAQLRMPAGVLKTLRVNVVSELLPESGNFQVMVRLNGADTNLVCLVPGTGSCNKSGGTGLVINNNDRLAIRASSSLVNSGGITYTYTLIFD
jgi:hypothetical protein